MFFKSNLRTIRERKNISPSEAAKVIGMSEKEYLKYERHPKELDSYDVLELSRFFGTSMLYIAGYSNDPNSEP